ncbi:hypothetical protein GCM10010911_09710 [Paenibacillus nasutitermitis]|uniref:Uncharacterized protein n=1 Tax=Paenibacillus nasutitermitis TaxID=1652958 RepID=A0A916YPT0_9BACL|nr:hypothetical protein GCM10010911_09710 [Paenibacillus nasutitermitis]
MTLVFRIGPALVFLVRTTKQKSLCIGRAIVVFGHTHVLPNAGSPMDTLRVNLAFEAVSE